MKIRKEITISTNEFITERTRIISKMLDNPDECGIYPTSECFAQFDALFDRIVSHHEHREKEARDAACEMAKTVQDYVEHYVGSDYEKSEHWQRAKATLEKFGWAAREDEKGGKG